MTNDSNSPSARLLPKTGRGERVCEFRFYEELNAFLPPEWRKKTLRYAFNGTPSVKDAIQALGVPKTEVDLILVDGQSVNFSYRLQGGERVAVYPVFESLEIGGLQRLRFAPLRETKFVLDVHLGKLVRWLRLAGFDCRYQNDFSDQQLIDISNTEHRILLTRDTGILKRNEVSHGLFVHQTEPEVQCQEILSRLDLYQRMQPFSRCLRCNGELKPVAKQEVAELLPERVRRDQSSFVRCQQCRKIYWPGSHYSRLRERFQRWQQDAPTSTS
ncbi:Mut7-C RNAse domain-containing protein [Permianibacter aggregans]|uniref:Twitching motility protein PilT n=1 Tax=Permianibacter aggregans TaxID=1510150 RepID=A0A4R6USU7_9GAMM|nr:Mut7-C RNAse domain-containing protein [Permianibacter aggregans]QGX40780.1 twitching motility protein PilT [Permianibacter aggregans]TDQ48405.1 hypothetical protein EV696_107142 [Permianibacter aggregans]